MKAKNLIFILLLAAAGIRAKAGDASNNNLIKLVSEAGEQIHLATSQSDLIPQGQVSHLVFDCKRKLTTGEITCRIPNQFVNTLQGSSLISQVVASQDKQTLLSLVFKSSKRGASMGAIIGGIVGGYLVGQELYKAIRVLRTNPNYDVRSPRREVLEMLIEHPGGSDLGKVLQLPRLLLGADITMFSSQCCGWLMDHSPFPPKFSEYFFLMLSGIMKWTLAGALFGAVGGPVFLAMHPYQTVPVALMVAHKQS